MTAETRVAVLMGGALGTLLRFLVEAIVPIDRFPAATLVVNLIGAYALGRLVGSRAGMSIQADAFLGTGLLGGFTTFSAIAVDLVALGNQPLLVAVYGTLTLGGGLALARLGRRQAQPSYLPPPDVDRLGAGL